MRHNPFELPYNQSKYISQQEEEEDEFINNYLRDYQYGSSKHKTSKSKDFYKKSRPSKKKHHQKIYNQTQNHFPWQDRYKGKSNRQFYGQKFSTKEKLNVKQKNIQYDSVFRQLCFGNSTDVLTAAITYKEILESIVLYMMEKELEMEVICNLKNDNKSQLKLKQPRRTGNTDNNKPKDDKIELQLGPSAGETVLATKSIQTFQINQDDAQQDRNEFLSFDEDRKFVLEFRKFKQVSSPNSIISVIPYKSIPSLLIIQSLNFIILKTSQAQIANYFQPQDELIDIYKEMHSIAQQSKRYLLEEKLKKGLRYIAEVQSKINKIYSKKGFKNRNSQNKNDPKIQDKKDTSGSEFQERKISSGKDEGKGLVEERKEQSEKLGLSLKNK